MLASSKLSEIPGGLGDNVIIQPEDDTSGMVVVNRDIKLDSEVAQEEHGNQPMYHTT